MRPPTTERKPWPMKWVVLAIAVVIPAYTYLTLHFRKPGPAFAPYRDMRDRADVVRLLSAGYRRMAIEAERPADAAEAPKSAAPTFAAAGGIPAELKTTLIESPLLPLDIERVAASAAAHAGAPYKISLTCTLADRQRQLSGAHLYVKESEIAVIPDFEPLPDSLSARTQESPILLTIPPGTLKPGVYRCTLIGERTSRTWTITIDGS